MSEAFEGHEPRECGEHRTVGPHRAWCFDCSEWCYPDDKMACNGCRIPKLEAALDRELTHGRCGSWFAGQVTPEQHAHGWVRNEDGTPAVLWRPYLQTGGDAVWLSVTFRSREDCEKFIHEEVLPGDH